jgi:DUF1009 family protein
MPTPKENRAEVSIILDNITKLGIIAGNGTLPRDLVQRAQSQNIECHVIGFKPHTNYVTPDLWAEVGKASRILNYLKTHNVKHLVFIGGIGTPNFKSLRLDWVTIKFFLTTWWHSFGDSNVLSSARKTLEEKGFTLIGIHRFLPELLMLEGHLGCINVADHHHADIQLGVEEALALGQRDQGQAVIVKDGHVIAYEDKRGTNKMIELHGEEGAILVKLCKPQQDHDLDLPTIGPKTLRRCAAKKMAGIVGHSGKMLVAEQNEVIKLADENELFVWGYNDTQKA